MIEPRFPAIGDRLGLGVGLDLRYGDSHGFEHQPGIGDRIGPRVLQFLRAQAFRYAFFSFQPRDRRELKLSDYVAAWDHLFENLPALHCQALHHTMLNLASLDDEERGPLLEFTNALLERYDLAWVNEDLGIWRLGGRPMPYPLPPLLTEAGLERAIREVSAVQAALCRPLLLEFPGFSDGTNFIIGDLHAYDFFRVLAEETGVAVTLDTGHLLSYQWLLGRRGDALYEDLDRLPLAHAFEIHLSGCEILDGRFVDVHHGVLRLEQLTLLERLLARCPNVRAVAYEDPKLTEAGQLRPRARPAFGRLSEIVHHWQDEPMRRSA